MSNFATSRQRAPDVISSGPSAQDYGGASSGGSESWATVAQDFMGNDGVRGALDGAGPGQDILGPLVSGLAAPEEEQAGLEETRPAAELHPDVASFYDDFDSAIGAPEQEEEVEVSVEGPGGGAPIDWSDPAGGGDAPGDEILDEEEAEEEVEEQAEDLEEDEELDPDDGVDDLLDEAADDDAPEGEVEGEAEEEGEEAAEEGKEEADQEAGGDAAGDAGGGAGDGAEGAEGADGAGAQGEGEAEARSRPRRWRRLARRLASALEARHAPAAPA